MTVTELYHLLERIPCDFDDAEILFDFAGTDEKIKLYAEWKVDEETKPYDQTHRVVVYLKLS